jgi:type II restriction/modification system DNA methylase subunit YeeA
LAHSRNKHESRLQELIGAAKQMNIEVRTEKLLREVGYRIRSGHCRLKDRELIVIDRDAPISDQIDFLAAELEYYKIHNG